ncbi:MAG: glycosyltransferase family 8 protein [Clostridia bacterium]|nr:glycosyltransferase family 8 protein [Clostridia bacterium]
METKNAIFRKGWNEADVELKTPLKADCGASKAEENKKGIKREKKGTIPLFFATDDNYLPFLSVALESIWENSSREYDYEMYVLHSGIRAEYEEKILRYNEKEGFHISFVDVTEPLKAIAKHLHMRDYYTCTTYFRIFIAGMFPQYDKALYLDCDIVALGDIATLYHYDLGNNLLGGAPCEGVNSFQVYKDYVSKVDGLDPDYFFNAGVILMNLKAFREEGFYEQFADLLQKYKFTVIQDEDYLNVLCQDRVLRLPRAWNKTPVAPDKLAREDLRIVHYLMTWKPWRYSDIPYQEYFWEYAEKTEFYSLLKEMRDSATDEAVEKDKQCEAGLKALAQSEIDRADGYFKTYGKLYGNVDKKDA